MNSQSQVATSTNKIWFLRAKSQTIYLFPCMLDPINNKTQRGFNFQHRELTGIEHSFIVASQNDSTVYRFRPESWKSHPHQAPKRSSFPRNSAPALFQLEFSYRNMFQWYPHSSILIDPAAFQRLGNPKESHSTESPNSLKQTNHDERGRA